MSHEVANDITSLWNELKLAYDKAVQKSPDRVSEIDTVFAVTDNLRCCINRGDGIANEATPHGPLSVDDVDELHTILWSNIEAIESISQHSRLLFTLRETPILWRGKEISNIVEAIREEALQYSWILQNNSQHRTFASSDSLRELYPDPWFDIAGVQDVARRIRERLQVAPPDSDSLWTAAEESEARRLVNAGTVTTATRLRELLSMNQAASQALFRHIKGKAKKVHRRG